MRADAVLEGGDLDAYRVGRAYAHGQPLKNVPVTSACNPACAFRRKAATDSDPKRPLIPI